MLDAEAARRAAARQARRLSQSPAKQTAPPPAALTSLGTSGGGKLAGRSPKGGRPGGLGGQSTLGVPASTGARYPSCRVVVDGLPGGREQRSFPAEARLRELYDWVGELTAGGRLDGGWVLAEMTLGRRQLRLEDGGGDGPTLAELGLPPAARLLLLLQPGPAEQAEDEEVVPAVGSPEKGEGEEKSFPLAAVTAEQTTEAEADEEKIMAAAAGLTEEDLHAAKTAQLLADERLARDEEYVSCPQGHSPALHGTINEHACCLSRRSSLSAVVAGPAAAATGAR